MPTAQLEQICKHINLILGWGFDLKLLARRRLQVRMAGGVLIEGRIFDIVVVWREAASEKDDRWSFD